MDIITGWIVLSLIIGLVAKDKSIGFWGGFIISLLLSPIIGIIFVLVSKNRNPKCNYNYIRSSPENSFLKGIKDKMQVVDRELFKGNKEKALDILMDMAYDVHQRISKHGKYEDVDTYKKYRRNIISKIEELGGNIPEVWK